jgi:hypothetical protein
MSQGAVNSRSIPLAASMPKGEKVKDASVEEDPLQKEFLRLDLGCCPSCSESVEKCEALLSLGNSPSLSKGSEVLLGSEASSSASTSSGRIWSIRSHQSLSTNWLEPPRSFSYSPYVYTASSF